jgi:hypothetical protein
MLLKDCEKSLRARAGRKGLRAWLKKADDSRGISAGRLSIVIRAIPLLRISSYLFPVTGS